MSRATQCLTRREINTFKRAPEGIKKREINTFLRECGIDVHVLNEIIIESYKKSIHHHFGGYSFDYAGILYAVRNTLFNMMAERYDDECNLDLCEAQYIHGEIDLFEDL